MPVSTDQKKIDRLLTKCVIETVVAADLKKKLLSGKKLRIKLGADPTSPDLHLGHAVQLRKLREFQELGHQIVFIIGDYTARVGDPSGKSKTRPMLTEEDVERNAKTYFEQAAKILDVKKMEVHRNGEWFAKMDFGEILKLAAQFTVARLIERDDFQKRLKEGTDVHLHELLYPAMQAHDSVMIEADVEIGGTDQRFNILAGRDLQRKVGQPEQDCMFLGPTLVGTDGTKKMSKSYGNYVGLLDAPEDMFGKTMSIPDALIWDWFALTTDVTPDEIAEMRTACEKGQMNPRDAKARLAKEIISLYHPAGAAEAAEENFRKVFQKKEVPDEVPEVVLPAGETALIEVLVAVKFVASKGEARRVIAEGGVKVAGEIVKDIAARVTISKKPLLIQKGKRHFVNAVAE